MTRSDPPPRSPWLPWFVASLVLLAGSLAALAWVTFDTLSDGDDASSAPANPFGPSAPGPERQLRVWVDPAAHYTIPAELNVETVATAEEADLTISGADDDTTFVAKRLVPVAALHTGVDALTFDQVRGLERGEFTDWSQVGGQPGPVTIGFVPDGTQRLELVQADGTPRIPPDVLEFPTYADLLAAMTPTSGMLAFLPVEEVTPAVMAIAVDGMDIVRDRGDLPAWPLNHTLGIVAQTDEGEAAAGELAIALTAPFPEATTVVATGDILQSRCSLAEIEATGDWGAALRGPVGEYLAVADLTLGSLDGSIQDINPVYRCESTTNLSSPPEVIEALTLAGFDGLTLATNHTLDCGVDYCGTDALLRTIELVTAAGIKPYGAGANLDAALAPAIFEVNGVTFGVLAFDDVAAYVYEATADSPGTAPLDDSYVSENAAGDPAFFHPAEELDLVRFETLIRELDQVVDVVIVQVQSGIEDTHTPSERSIKALRVAAAAGADLVVGNQAHWVQAAEVRDDVWISYALGNFIFDQVHTAEHTQGYLLEATFWGDRLANVRLVPYQIEGQYKPTFVTAELRAKILGDVFNASAELPE